MITVRRSRWTDHDNNDNNRTLDVTQTTDANVPYVTGTLSALHDWTLAANRRVKVRFIPVSGRAAMIGTPVCSKGKRRPFNRPVSSVRFHFFNTMEIPGSTGWMLISLPLPDTGT